MRDTHYVIFATQKKTIDYGFLEVPTQWKLLTEDYVIGVAHIMNCFDKHIVLISITFLSISKTWVKFSLLESLLNK